MIILGINFRHGDASACIIKNGKILSAVEEERFTQIKYCSHFPINSIKYCLVPIIFPLMILITYL